MKTWALGSLRNGGIRLGLCAPDPLACCTSNLISRGPSALASSATTSIPGSCLGRLGGQAVPGLHQQLDRIRQVLLNDVMIPTLDAEPVGLQKHVGGSESFGWLELVTG